MIPSIRDTSPLQAQYLAFIEALKACGFAGDLNPDYANRTVLATDNSIYQILPQGVIYPKNTADLVRIAELSNMKEFRAIVLSARGGGTGTNGQSLSNGLVVDVSKHMNQILEINVEQRWARVQAGVVKDQLNAALKPHGLFFAPELSTSNRATLGGMINTDASGQGSCLYGKTRDHVLQLHTVFLDGSEWTSNAIDDEELAAISQRQDRVGLAHRVIHNLQQEHADLIAATFPPLNRCLTGYDLAHIRDENGMFNLNSVLCGSEGTLGFIDEAKLNLLPIPKCTALVNIRYKSFNHALRDATALMQANPTSIETLDANVLHLAQKDIVWNSVAEFFPAHTDSEIEAINLVEFTADTEQELEVNVRALTTQLDVSPSDTQKNDAHNRIGYTLAWGLDDVDNIWAMRKKSVGLLGNTDGEARPVPFVEDTAVPPQNLADFIVEFRQLLDENGLQYGMFGHVDAGVLHVRPKIDLKDPKQEALIRPITDAVVELVHKYNGLLWGEHGKGVRSEFAPLVFRELYPQLQRIKASFDPHNQLNPGKIATPGADSALLRIDSVPTRGQQDRRIPTRTWEAYREGMYCNGNGACFNWDPNDTMCPSWKGTRERIHSPKGRASLIREWLRQLSERGVDPDQVSQQYRRTPFIKSLLPKLKNSWSKFRGNYDFSHEVHNAMMGCLACKSCVGQCPIKVDVPEFRSKFLELYHSRYLRPPKDYVIAGLEFALPTLAKVPGLYNALMRPRLLQQLTAKLVGLVDNPLLTTLSLDKAMADLNIQLATPGILQSLSEEEKHRSVIIVQDAFTSFFETQLVVDTLKLLQRLGFTPFVAPFKPNGKPLHVHGFLKAFSVAAEKNAHMLRALQDTGVPLVGIEPSTTLTYRSEYAKLFSENTPTVMLIQEWLATQLHTLSAQQDIFEPGNFKLLSHCTEKTNAPTSIKEWQAVFNAVGLQATSIEVGCCGMAGTYGHDVNYVATAKKIYAQSWAPVINNAKNDGLLMTSGYSCRCQIKRIDQKLLPHPIQILLRQIRLQYPG